MNFHHPFFPRHQFLFKGIGNALPSDPLAKALGLGKNLAPNSQGGPFGNSADAGAAINAAQVPLPAETSGPDSDAVMQAEHDIAQQSLLKKSVKNTILAGDTGGYLAASTAAGTGAK